MALTSDHKPNTATERQRITLAGGQIYQSTAQLPGKKNLVGPFRVRPGGLSVSRAIGDPVAKFPSYGGNPKVVVSTPDITSFKITNDHDFIIIGSDGIFDQLSNEDVVKCVWNSTLQEKALNVHKQCGVAIDCIMKNALARRSLDNITAAIIAFKHFRTFAFPAGLGNAQGQKYQPSKEYTGNEYKQRLEVINLNSMYPQSTREARKDTKFGFDYKELNKRYYL